MSKPYSLLLVDNPGDLGWVTINRTKDRNSINTALMEEVSRLIDETEATPTRGLVFTGAGVSHFIGGADGVEMMQLDPDGATDFSTRIQNLFNRMETSSLILVAAINGLCFGGGYEFALACDFRIAVETARIGLPEVKVGLIPGGGGTQRLPRLVGVGRAMEAILSGRLYPAKEALDIGLIHHLAPTGKLRAEVFNYLEPILKNPQPALIQAKRAVRASQYLPFFEGLAVENLEFQKCFTHPFFVNLMHQQIKDGTVETTAELPDGFLKKEG